MTGSARVTVGRAEERGKPSWLREHVAVLPERVPLSADETTMFR